MSFYPLFDILENRGFVNISNFAPNSWENVPVGDKNIFVFQSNGSAWEVIKTGTIPKNEYRNFDSSEFQFSIQSNIEGVFIGDLVLIEMRLDELPAMLEELPNASLPSTHWPEWRATIGFKSSESFVSYQGEINPTPINASLLTFHPFIQFIDIKNYFVFVNIEKSPIHRWAEIHIYNSLTGSKIDVKKIRNNAVNIIPLDDYGFTPEDLPVFYCKNMAGIPFGFGKSISTNMLSLEHTHPPGSLTIHGDRNLAQREIKLNWSKFLKA